MPVPAVLALDGVVRDYAWGSTTALQSLLGVAPDGRPAAELWLGAHPDDPALVPARSTTLDKVIAADPEAALGPDVITQFGPRLPFLLKVLAADKALSMQVHPTIEQARAGFASENARGIAQDAPERTYRDPNHKPELLCALTPFDALCGFRPVPDTLRLLDALGRPELAAVRELLVTPAGLRAAFTHLLGLADPGVLVDAVVAAAAGLTGEWTGTARAVALTASDFPGDIGVVLGLLLNHVRLEPGEAIYLGAGNVHSYLRGTGVEIMANSDNVLRCGLTPKHIDVPALLEVTDFSELAEPRWPSTCGPGEDVRAFAVPVPDFGLLRLDFSAYGDEVAGGPGGPRIVLCASGRATVRADGDSVELTAGRAAFLPASDGGYRVAGIGLVFVAGTGSGL